MTQFAALSWTVKRKRERSSFVMWRDIGCWGERTSEDSNSSGRTLTARSPRWNFVFLTTLAAVHGRRAGIRAIWSALQPTLHTAPEEAFGAGYVNDTFINFSHTAVSQQLKWNECAKYMLVHLLWHTFISKTMCACYLEHNKKRLPQLLLTHSLCH